MKIWTFKPQPEKSLHSFVSLPLLCDAAENVLEMWAHKIWIEGDKDMQKKIIMKQQIYANWMSETKTKI